MKLALRVSLVAKLTVWLSSVSAGSPPPVTVTTYSPEASTSESAEVFRDECPTIVTSDCCWPLTNPSSWHSRIGRGPAPRGVLGPAIETATDLPCRNFALFFTRTRKPASCPPPSRVGVSALPIGMATGRGAGHPGAKGGGPARRAGASR